MEKTKLNIQGNTTISTDNWEDGWDMISAISDAIKNSVVTDDSSMTGKITLPVCSKSEKKRVEDEFDVEIDVDEDLQQFEDREVCKVIAANAGGGNLVSKENFEKITNINAWFKENTDIEHFDELAYMSVDKVNLTGCTNLRSVDFHNITTVSSNYGLRKCPVKRVGKINKVGFFPKLQSLVQFLSAHHDMELLLFPVLTNQGFMYTRGDGYEIAGRKRVYDFGKKINICNLIFWMGDSYNSGYVVICRAKSQPTHNNNGWDITKVIYIPNESIDFYTNYDTQKLKPIGGVDWCEEFGCKWNGPLDYDSLPNNIKYADVYKYGRNEDGTENTEEINKIIEAYENA